MKNLFAIAVLIIFFSATSCKKKYSCECTWTDPIFGTTEVGTHDYDKQKEDDAKSGCDEQAAAYAVEAPDATCVLKKL